MAKELMRELGYRDKDIDFILSAYSLQSCTNDRIKRNLKDVYCYLLDLGYTKEEVIKMTRKFPTLCGYTKEKIHNKIDDLIKLGYTKEEVIKLGKKLPSIYGYSISKIKDRINYLESIGYNKKDILTMGKHLPQLYGMTIKNISTKINDLIEMGYSEEDVILMTKDLPSIYSYSIDSMKKKFDNMVNLGYSSDEVLKMTKSFSTIYGYNTDNIREKIEFYDSIGLHDMVVLYPMRLRQSVDLSYARYEYLKDMGIEITIDNCKKLFIEEEQFERSYNIKKAEILDLYNYRKNKEGIVKCKNYIA